ncbi:MAG TPA: chloride channel protein, partial [Bacteroidia bacterium]|nr:chloride channel protein [Bacteroidia bacterium]
MKFIKSYELIINWLHEKLTKRQFLILASILVGLTAGLAAVILKTLVHYIHYAITTDYHLRFQYYIYLIFPILGLVLTAFIVQRFFKGKQGRGPANIIHSILKKSAILPKDQMYSQVLTSAITVGFGGSAGLESPMVTTGSAIGSNFGRTYHLHYKDRVLLLASGAAAGIAAAFDSPIAGVLFALEVLLTDVSITVFIPLIMAAATGALCSHIILKEGILLSFPK